MLVKFVVVSRLLCALLLVTGIAAVDASPAHADKAKLTTHQNYVEDTLRSTDVPFGNIKNVFGWVLGNLPDRVKVYPTENYYYFKFMHDGQNYSGNIRLDAKDRDDGKLHFAYFEDMQEYRVQPLILYRVLDKTAGVIVENVDRLLYKVTYKDKSVLFELNDLSKVVPPQNAVAADEIFIGPVFDDSALQFFLMFNTRLKIFHYVLDETVKVNDTFLTAQQSDRILIGQRTGFAFYKDSRTDRKILIGVFEANARVNNYFDGPFDQLPDNFIEGDILKNALIESEPTLEGKIDRYGHYDNGAGRISIAPYTYYKTEADLLQFTYCANDTRVPADEYYSCFMTEWSSGQAILRPYRKMVEAAAAASAASTETAGSHQAPSEPAPN
jgi:hypothetical protein